MEDQKRNERRQQCQKQEKFQYATNILRERRYEEGKMLNEQEAAFLKETCKSQKYSQRKI